MDGRGKISGLILAAGEGKRFGGLKQLERSGPRHVMQYAVDAMLDVDLIDRVAMTVGAGADEVVSTIDLDGVEVIRVPGWEEGMAASLRAGVAALAEGSDAIVVTLADQPLISSPMITRVIEARDGTAQAVRATHDGRPGHPVLLAASLISGARLETLPTGHVAFSSQPDQFLALVEPFLSQTK